jgi:two-component system, NarL family, sensor kinase
MLFMGFFAFRYYKNRQQILKQQQEIQQQKISQLEKDKQLLNIEAMLKGQEEERNRIAKDLHDGLGGLLSGVKLSFMSLKEKLPVTSEGESGFEHSTRMIDRTITELRKVAHNLTPEILMKFGLEEALREFCGSIEASSDVKVVLQLLGKHRKLVSHAESAVYRIVQELVNNALKHAQAGSILVQLTYHDEKITLTVEDNGKGFDTTELLSKNGTGISNIQHRVNYFKGMIDIDSMPGKGTSITIELYA